MDEKLIRVSIKSRTERMEYERRRAIDAIATNDFEIAALAIAAANFQRGAINELEFLLECMEVES